MTNNTGVTLKYYIQLSKLKIMIPVCLTGFTGYFILDPHLSSKIIFVSIGILLLAIAASVLNQIQERDLDRKMNRTKNRPLVAGRINVNHAFLFFLFNIISGTALIYMFGNINAALIGILTVLWYNGVYTYSKRITAFAVVPGAVTGALPPLIGWVAAGGAILDKPIIFLGFLLFIGQVPHFWLLILKYGEEYKDAGIPSLTSVFTKNQIKRLTFIWVMTSVAAALFLCYFEIFINPVMIIMLLIASSIIVWRFSHLLHSRSAQIDNKQYSILLDSYFLVIILLLITDRIVI